LIHARNGVALGTSEVNMVVFVMIVIAVAFAFCIVCYTISTNNFVNDAVFFETIENAVYGYPIHFFTQGFFQHIMRDSLLFLLEVIQNHLLGLGMSSLRFCHIANVQIERYYGLKITR
jgi:hypothetical protein